LAILKRERRSYPQWPSSGRNFVKYARLGQLEEAHGLTWLFGEYDQYLIPQNTVLGFFFGLQK